MTCNILEIDLRPALSELCVTSMNLVTVYVPCDGFGMPGKGFCSQTLITDILVSEDLGNVLSNVVQASGRTAFDT